MDPLIVTPQNVLIFVALLIGLGGLLSSLFNFRQTRREQRAYRSQVQEEEGETTEQRINRLTITLSRALSEAAQAIRDIEADISDKHKTAERLSSEIQQYEAQYEALKDLSEPQVEAIVQFLDMSVKREGRRNLVSNFVFFALGVISSVVTGLLIG